MSLSSVRHTTTKNGQLQAMESMLTSNKRLEDFIYLNKIKTEKLNPDWLKKWKYLSLNVYLFSPQNKTVNPVSRY